MKDYSKEKADVFSTPEEGLAKLTEIIGKSYKRLTNWPPKSMRGRSGSPASLI